MDLIIYNFESNISQRVALIFPTKSQICYDKVGTLFVSSMAQQDGKVFVYMIVIKNSCIQWLSIFLYNNYKHIL